jgi:hypothetical protein
MPKRSTTDQLREDGRRGRTRDEIQMSDPAAVPLGTDEEAGGSPRRERLCSRLETMSAPWDARCRIT